MSFFSEAAIRAGVPELALSTGYNIINYNGECVYIEGVRRLLKIDEQEISVELRGAVLTLKGERLNLFELSEAAIIKGTVADMEFKKIANVGRGRRDDKKKKPE